MYKFKISSCSSIETNSREKEKLPEISGAREGILLGNYKNATEEKVTESYSSLVLL